MSVASTGSLPQRRGALAPALTIGALGVVFGDIGTSPIYAFREAFVGAHPLLASQNAVFGVLSLLFWALMLIVTLKYVFLVLRFDNRGEGGVLALLALAARVQRARPRVKNVAVLLALVAASLFFGDAVITPAISVLSAVEGISVAEPGLAHWVLPITIAILVGLFAIQHRGTGEVGKLFGPVMILWFVALAALGIVSIAQTPSILHALDPRYAWSFVTTSPKVGFLVLGAVFLVLTGAEALYADMGHFGRGPIRIAWFGLVLPSLMLNYFGQGALVLRTQSAAENPFYLLAPDALLLPLTALATLATVIASQATISGAYSMTQQASRLGYLPRIPVLHTSATERGQIYVGTVNWTMLVLVVLLVAGFQSSSNLAAAYGIAVSGTMLLTTFLVVVVFSPLNGRRRALVFPLLALVGVIELVFFASNATKIPAGGWFPLAAGAVLYTLLSTWKGGSELVAADQRRMRVPLEGLFEMLGSVTTVPGTAIFFSADAEGAPATLLHVLKHFKVLFERTFLLTIVNEEVPRVPAAERVELRVLEAGRRYRVILRYGFMENPDIPQALSLLEPLGVKFDMAATTFFLGRTTIAKAPRVGLAWRREIFRWMQRNAPSSAEYLRLPVDRVVELGTQIVI